MILSTSVTNSRSSALRTLAIYVGITAFTALFGAVYETFSHGVYTYYMLYAFAYPLALGVIPYIAIVLKGMENYSTQLSSVIYHSGVATLTVGSIIEGVLVIYGTTNDLTGVYPIIGDALLISAVVLKLVNNRKQ